LVKNWNLNYWSNLLRLIQKKIPNSYFYFFGGKEDFNKTDFFLKNNKSLKTKNICGLYSIKKDIFLISKMNYFLSIDSGNAHIASILKIPTLVIMSSASLKGNWNALNGVSLNAPCDCQGKGYKACELNQRKCIMSLCPSSVLKIFINTLN
jgi:ADP-heptose:LPS heptosyltransferase